MNVDYPPSRHTSDTHRLCPYTPYFRPCLILASLQVPVHVAGCVPRGSSPGHFSFDDKDAKHMADFTQFALHATSQELAQSQLLTTLNNANLDRIGVSISSAIGGIDEILQSHNSFNESYKKLSPFFIPKVLVNMAAGHISLK